MADIEINNLKNLSNEILNTIKESILVLDPELRVIYANPSFYAHFKVTPKDTEQRCVYDLGNKQWNIPELRRLLEEILPKKTVIDKFEVEHDFPQIGKKIMNLNARKIKDGPKQLILIIIEDITEEKLLLELAMRESKLSAVGQLSASLSHGLNSPLTGIHNFLQVYQDQEKKGSERSNELKLMLEACNYMSAIVKNLTHFTSDAQDEFNDISLADVVDSTLLFVERQFTANNIQIIREIPKKLDKVRGNKSQLQHAVLNILVNAKEAMNNRGKITIKAQNSDRDKSVMLEIIDDGMGIPKEDMSRLFTPFFTTKSGSGGSGLGLSAAYRIITSHHGTIRIESEKGKGTHVIITLPAAK